MFLLKVVVAALPVRPRVGLGDLVDPLSFQALSTLLERQAWSEGSDLADFALALAVLAVLFLADFSALAGFSVLM